MRSRHTLGILALILVLVSVAAAGCGGGGGDSPGVANLGTTGTTTNSSSGGAPSGSGPSTSSGDGSGAQMTVSGSHGLAFSRCMRAHGVKNFPDPNSQGQIQFGSDSGIDPNSPTFKAAQQACQKKLGGGQLSPAQQAQFRQQALAFAACMRKHGVPDVPDPTFSGGGVNFSIQGNANGDLNPNSPTFKAAQQACQGRLPAKPGASGSPSRSGGAK